MVLMGTNCVQYEGWDMSFMKNELSRDIGHALHKRATRTRAACQKKEKKNTKTKNRQQ